MATKRRAVALVMKGVIWGGVAVAAHIFIGGILPADGSRPVPAPPAEYVAGTDFAFLGKDGAPVRWSCSGRIAVSLMTPVDGADAAIGEGVAMLADLTGLPLEIVSAGDATAEIQISYGEIPGRDAAAEEGTVGITRPMTRGAELVRALIVILDEERYLPSTAAGRAVLLHELGHAVGLDHSAQETGGMMTPVLTLDAGGEPTPGELWALQAVGCLR
ncbi:MAG: matrixin family metalloprotease [Microbacterium sp.]